MNSRPQHGGRGVRGEIHISDSNLIIRRPKTSPVSPFSPSSVFKSRSVVVALLFINAVASAATLGITLTPDKKDIDAGAPVVIHGSAKLPPGAVLALPEKPLPDDSPFSVISFKPSPAGDFELTIAAFALGPQTLPALDWKLVLPDGKTETVNSAPIPFKVGAPEADKPGAELYDIAQPYRPRVYWPWIVAFLLLIAAGIAWKWFTKPRLKDEAIGRRKLPPHEEALERLKQLIASGLWESRQVKEYYSELADILRDYLHDRFQLQSRMLTTGALMRQMRELEIDAPVSREARSFLESCDFAKFAKWKPTETDRDTDVKRLENLINATKPQSQGEPQHAAPL